MIAGSGSRTTARRSMIAGLASLGAATLRPRAAGAATATVKFGSVGGLSDAGLYIAEEDGYFSAAGITLEMQKLNIAPVLVQAIAASQLDVAGIAITPGLFAAVAMHINLRLVGDKQSYRRGFSGMRLIARPGVILGTEKATLENLKGKSVALSSKGSTSYYFLDRALASVNLSLADVKVVELIYPNMYPAFTSGIIDAAFCLEPFLTEIVRQGAAKQVSDLIEFIPGGTMTNVPIVYSETFAKNRVVAQNFMTAYMKGVRVYNDAFDKGIDKKRVIDVISRRAKLSPDIVRAANPAGLDPDQRVNVAVLEDVQAFYVREGMLASPVNVSRVVDSSFAQRAVGLLGSYRA